MSSSRDKIISKIRKLLAIASSSNQNEALNCNSIAQELITKYQIEEAELNVRNNVKIEFTSSIINSGTKSSVFWKQKLLNVICETNTCALILSKELVDEGSRATRYEIVGSKDNIELVSILFELISNQVEYFAKDSKCKGKSEMNSFKLGIVTRVGQRLKETKEKAVSEYLKLNPLNIALSEFGTTESNKNNSALVYLNKEKLELEIYIKRMIPNLKSGKEKSVNLKKEAYEAGFKKGDSVILQNRKALK